MWNTIKFTIRPLKTLILKIYEKNNLFHAGNGVAAMCNESAGSAVGR